MHTLYLGTYMIHYKRFVPESKTRTWFYLFNKKPYNMLHPHAEKLPRTQKAPQRAGQSAG